MNNISYWNELNKDAINEKVADDTVIILPIGSTEQHGPHLPTGVDSFIVEDIISVVLPKVAPNIQVITLPMISYGKSEEHKAFPGNLSLTGDTLTCVVRDIVQSVVDNGFKRIIFFNGHGGNYSILGSLMREFRLAHNIMAVHCDWDSLYNLKDNIAELDELKYGIHGGEVETSLMLATRPELVNDALCNKFDNKARLVEEKNVLLRLYGAISVGWAMHDLNEQGSCGDASNASATKGEHLINLVSERFALLIKEVAEFDLSLLQDSTHNATSE